MPRLTLPPTPASSTDIKGKDGSKQLAGLQMAFELPPPAVVSNEPSLPPSPESRRPSKDSSSQRSPPETPYPVQASETVKSRRRSSAAQPPKTQFSLPPPPTRSRKIIQVKPRSAENTDNTATSSNSKSGGSAKSVAAAAAASSSASQPAAPASGSSKKKQPSSTSAAGRKIARKTAHSLIERRRRSKMNEEFAVLKGMIPACTGEMHKLAILQASIEYLRYLEDCVAKLKARQEADPDSGSDGFDLQPPPEYHAEPSFQPCTRTNSPDVDMTGVEAQSPTYTESNPRSQRPSVSPAILAQDQNPPRNSPPLASTDQRQRHYSFSISGNTSPSLGPQSHRYPQSAHSGGSASTFTSPALAPQRDMDQEATAALLMLNQSDRRGSNKSQSGRGMSVRDLLIT